MKEGPTFTVVTGLSEKPREFGWIGGGSKAPYQAPYTPCKTPRSLGPKDWVGRVGRLVGSNS